MCQRLVNVSKDVYDEVTSMKTIGIQTPCSINDIEGRYFVLISLLQLQMKLTVHVVCLYIELIDETSAAVILRQKNLDKLEI